MDSQTCKNGVGKKIQISTGRRVYSQITAMRCFHPTYHQTVDLVIVVGSRDDSALKILLQKSVYYVISKLINWSFVRMAKCH
jgi:hypothetical protein